MTPHQEATRFIEFCNGLEQAGGMEEYAHRGRMMARTVIELLDIVAAERSARRALQERCERQQNLLGHRAEEAMRLMEAKGWDGIPFGEHP